MNTEQAARKYGIGQELKFLDVVHIPCSCFTYEIFVVQWLVINKNSKLKFLYKKKQKLNEQLY
jgi:hypothetical protein